MIRINRKYQRGLLDIFEKNYFSSISDIHINKILDKESVYDKFLCIDISKSEIETPVFCRNIIDDHIYKKALSTDTLELNKAEEIVIPLYCNSSTKMMTTADSIITELFNKATFNYKIQKIISNKGELYYGGRGIILDRDFTPLFIATLSGEINPLKESIIFTYNKGTIYIHPKVFLNTECNICKSILKKIIPFYVSNNIYICSSYRFKNNLPYDYKPQITIEDTSKWIKKTQLPKLSEDDIDDTLNQLLIDNIDDVLESIWQ